MLESGKYMGKGASLSHMFATTNLASQQPLTSKWALANLDVSEHSLTWPCKWALTNLDVGKH